MKKVFKNGYSKDVQALLNLKGVVSRKGKPFSESYINHVFNGRNSNNDIENALIELYEKKDIELKRIQYLRREIFNNKKKPEAGTSGKI
ncbi:hypothetical protein [Flavobacterium panacagri]|uniref:hypothetical protein n=1 Tax=Flavobacterium panacagri TaxID=3034146 RepID=UPI0025A5AE10|nr:hypothetical protein [Flavobacterium panacagri]